MSPNPGSLGLDFLKKAQSKAGRLKPDRTNDFTKISTLLSSFRNDSTNYCYESVSENVNKLLAANTTLNNKYNYLYNNNYGKNSYKKYTYDELNDLLSNNTEDKVENNGEILVFGWVKSVRKQNNNKLLFVIVNDGSCKSDLQIVVHNEAKGFDTLIKSHSGCSVKANGFLVQRDLLNNQDKREDELVEKSQQLSNNEKNKYELLEDVNKLYELHITKYNSNYIELLGCNMYPDKYPIAKKQLPLEYLRDNAHLRPRTYLISAVMRVRNTLAMGIHLFFQSLGCNYLNSPIITTADCEGAGELFQVTTMFENVYKLSHLHNKILNLSSSDENNNDNNKLQEQPDNNNLCNYSENKNNEKKEVYVKDVKIKYDNDFFKKKSYLTCSGQLSAENYCCSMGSVYTFGPTFRAENSHTSRHLAEFWMIEPELLLVDLPKLMEISENFIKFLVSYVLNHSYDDLQYFNNTLDNELLERLNNILNEEFAHVSYTEVINILLDYVNNENYINQETKFEYNDIYWGMDLQSEHERFISEKVFNRPVIIYNYPKKIKAFYMRLNEDKDTVAAMDLIIPKIGELIGGSQREERLDYLLESIKNNKLNEKDYWWYLDLRKYGTVVHSGFGLGFERLIMMVTGVNNIRDVIPFPRYPGHSAF